MTTTIVLITACGVAFADGPSYSLIDLGTLGGPESFAAGINDAGQVTGHSDTTVNGDRRAFLYSNGILSNLGSLANGQYSEGFAINGLGQAAGDSYTGIVVDSNGNSGIHAVIFNNGGITDLGTLPGHLYSLAYGINDSGQVTGSSKPSVGFVQGFFYSNGTMTLIPGIPGSVMSSGNAINNSGDVAGVSFNSTNNATHAILYSNGATTDLGTLPGGTSSVGVAINSSRQVTGSADGQAFLYSNGSMTSLPTLGGTGGSGYAINDGGVVVGSSKMKGDTVLHAFYYSNGVTQDLNLLFDPTDPLAAFVTLTEARGINNAGAIAANGLDSRTGANQSHAYLLTPNGSTAITVSPATYAFGNQPIGTSSSSHAFTVTNTGSLPAAIGTISISGDFSETNTCATPVLPTATCAIDVSFSPTGPDSRNGTLTVPLTGTYHTVSLAGIGTAWIPAPDLFVTNGHLEVLLTWNAVEGAASYNVYSGTSAGGESATPLASGVTATEFIVSNLSAATTYYFVVQAVAGSTSSGPSNEVSIRPDPGNGGGSGGGGAVDPLSLVIIGALAARMSGSRRDPQGPKRRAGT
jgi:probable HAF family extracellular repeat protein